MCGISGMVAHKPLSAQQQAQVSWMSAALQHRGPDGEGVYQADHVALAMRRLAIIDLAGGWQPLYNEDRTLAIVCNGEIYNYIELQQELTARGHTLATNSDVETILHLYEDYGVGCVQHLRGMFAFALWDTQKRQLLLARDRMGEKPIYLYERAGELYFASELKALMQTGVVPFELDPAAIDLYFHYAYVPEPRTPIKHVRKLPAGHTLLIDVDSWTQHEQTYWRMMDAPPLTGDPVEAIRAELDKISEIVIRSDVPVGVSLSSGLDSSAVATLTAHKYPGTMHAFSVGYPGKPPNDERDEARWLADKLQMPFHDIEVDVTEMVNTFPETVFMRDDPIADISGYGYYAVMKLARQCGIPVVLQGQGGDELFWGYPWVQQAVGSSQSKQTVLQAKMPRWKYLIGSIWNTTHPNVPAHPRQAVRDLRRAYQKAAENWQHFHATTPETVVFIDSHIDYQVALQQRSGMYGAALHDQLNATSARDVFSFPLPWDDLDILMTDLISRTYLLENGIAQGDRLSMASSIEMRLPLVDYKLVETVIGHRKTQSDHHLPAKTWFKQAIKGIVPDEVLNRPKRGFAPPIYEWYRALLAEYGAQLEDGYLVEQGILSREAARRMAAGEGLMQGVMTLPFKALCLEVWCREFLAALETIPEAQPA
jgi:asparagine synthase (glutamine-hydrolysing)